MSAWNRWGPAIVLAVGLLGWTGRALTRPAWNLDGVFYVAAAEALRGQPDPHGAAYERVRREAPGTARRALLRGSRYRRRLATDPAAFAGQVRFYTAKPGYVALLAAVATLGISPFLGAHVLSTLALGGAAVVAFGLGTRVGSPWVAALATLALLGIPGVAEAGTLATPDALVALLVGVGIGLLGPGHALTPGAVGAWGAAIVLRPDAVLYAVPLVIASRGRARWGAVLGMLGLASLPSLLGWTHSWTMVLRQTLGRASTDLEALGRPIGLGDYLGYLGAGIRGHRALAPWGPAVVAAAALPALWGSRSRIGLAVWSGAVLHFAAVPLLADRFYLPAYFAMVPMLAAGWASLRGRGDRGGSDGAP